MQEISTPFSGKMTCKPRMELATKVCKKLFSFGRIFKAINNYRGTIRIRSESSFINSTQANLSLFSTSISFFVWRMEKDRRRSDSNNHDNAQCSTQCRSIFSKCMTMMIKIKRKIRIQIRKYPFC